MEILFIILVGAISGIIIDYLADVLPYTRRLTKPFCIICQKDISWSDYIRIRKCPECNSKGAIRGWIIRFFIPIVYIIFWFFPPVRIGFWIACIFTTVFSLVMIIDIEHRLIIQPVLIPTAVISFGMGWVLHGFTNTLIGGICGYLIMLILFYFGILFERLIARIRKIQLDEVALGFGDVNLSCVLGFILGFPAIFVGLILTIFLGGAASLLLILYTFAARRYRPFTAIPYAPFLILGTAILLFSPK